MSCRICGSEAGRTHLAREMMFGMRDEFDYFECNTCGCVQLIDPPSDMSPYYPADYYSFADPPPPTPLPKNPLRRWCFIKRNEAQIFHGRGPWAWVAARRPRADFRGIARILSPTPVRSLDARILDVGCGKGGLLRTFAAAGFRSLRGIDPFLPGPMSFGTGLHIYAEPLEKIAHEQFDFIMFNHSLEHIEDNYRSLRAATDLLAPGGVCLVRLPVASSRLWREYGTNWVELDAPRHFFLHTSESLRRIVTKVGLEVYHTEYDSTAFAYWASELYRRDRPLTSVGGLGAKLDLSEFSFEEMESFERNALRDNQEGTASSAAYYLRQKVLH